MLLHEVQKTQHNQKSKCVYFEQMRLLDPFITHRKSIDDTAMDSNAIFKNNIAGDKENLNPSISNSRFDSAIDDSFTGRSSTTNTLTKTYPTITSVTDPT